MQKSNSSSLKDSINYMVDTSKLMNTSKEVDVDYYGDTLSYTLNIDSTDTHTVDSVVSSGLKVITLISRTKFGKLSVGFEVTAKPTSTSITKEASSMVQNGISTFSDTKTQNSTNAEAKNSSIKSMWTAPVLMVCAALIIFALVFYLIAKKFP